MKMYLYEENNLLKSAIKILILALYQDYKELWFKITKRKNNIIKKRMNHSE